jgi:hypothetical protein
MEREGEYVVCVRCKGTGKVILEYEPFNGRKERKGVKKVRTGSGTILDDSSRATWITYDQFKHKF